MKILGIVFAILIGLFIVVMVIGSNTDYPEVGETVVLQSDTPGCPLKSTTAQLASLISQGDSKAGGELAYRARCTFLKTGSFVLQIKEPFEDYWCIRSQGSPDCLWVSKSSVRRPPK